MRTLIGAAEPPPRPEPSRISFTATSGTATTTAMLWWLTPTETAPRQPYRTTAYVGTPVPEIEQGGIE